MSTRVDGAEPPVIMLTAKVTLAAGTACLMLTVTQESGDLWRYSLSAHQNNRLANGKIIVPGHVAALAGDAQICAGGYQPGHHRTRPARRIRPKRAPDVSSADRPPAHMKAGALRPRRLPRTT